MQTRIMVPLDGSAFAKRALPLALALARRSGASVELVHVHERAPVATGASGFDVRLDTEERRRMRTELEALATTLAPETSVNVVVRFLDGDVVHALRQHLAHSRADLVVMMTHGRGGVSRLWLGSVADGLIRVSPVPVLLLHAGAEWPGELREPLFRRVLLPLDGSRQAEEIIPHVMSLATPGETTLVLLSVIDPGLGVRATTVDLDPALARGGPLTKRVRRTMERRLARLAAELRTNCVDVAVEVLVDPHPAQCIVRYADAQTIDLVALCTRARGPLGRLLLGATADKVVRNGRVPVLLHHTIMEGDAPPDDEAGRAARATPPT